jgi:exodeoxyribonuclease V gamma subunit
MATRERLHISFIGEGVRDGKARNPAAPVAELLQFLDGQHDISEKKMRPWLIKHPLQPFDARYFAGDSRLFTFDRAYENLPPRAEAPRFLDASAVHDAPPPREIALDWLKRYWRDPARMRLHADAGVSLEALAEATWPDREPLDAKLDRRDGVEQRLLRAALAEDASALPLQAPDWLARSGALAAGAAGARAYAQARARAQEVLELARPFLADTKPCVQPIELDPGDGIRVTGNIDAWRDASGRIRVFRAKPGGTVALKELLPFYIDFAAASLLCDADGLFVEYEKKARRPKVLDAILGQDRATLRAGLRCLIDLAVETQMWLPPYTAWDWMKSTPQARADNARKRWEGGEFGPRGERNFSAYAALAARGADFLDAASPAHARFADICARVAGVLDPLCSELLVDGSAKPRRRKT